MKRDNSMDVAFRDMDILRARARSASNISAAAIGACPIVPGTDASRPHICPDYSLDYLCANYNQVSIAFRSLAPLAVVTVTPNPLDSVFCPVAVSMVVRDSSDPTLTRTSYVFQVQVRGCFQFDWQNPADTVAGATSWVDSQAEWDPTFKSDCKACPVDWSCFTNPGLNTATLNMIIGNPHTAAITGQVKIWGIPYSCCPSFIDANDFRTGQRQRRPIPAGPAAPLGTAKRPSVFAGGSPAM